MIKKIVISLILFTMISYASVCAAENSNIERYYGSNGAVTLSRDIPAEASFIVVKGNKDWTSIKNDTSFLNTNTVFYEYVKNNSSGKHEFDFILDFEGIYSAFTGTDKTLFVYADEAENQLALQSLIGSNSTDFMGTLDGCYDSLASSTDLYSTGNSVAAGIIFKYIEGKSEIDRVEFAEAFDKAYLMTSINDGVVTNLSDYLYSAGIKGKTAERYYKPEYAEDIYEAVKGKTTIEEFNNTVITKLILNTVSKSNDVSLIKEILTEYADEIGLNRAYITDSSMRTINKAKYVNIDDLKTNLATLYNNSNSQNGQGSSGGGGNGGYVSSSNKAASSTVGGIGIGVNNSNTANSNTVLSIFEDLAGYDWARESIEGLYQKGIIRGKTVSEFFPADKVLREEFITMLILATKLNVVAKDITFVDVPENAWFYEYVNRGYKSGIINGISDEYFGVGRPITRQDMAVMIYNVLNVCGIPLEEFSENTYTDEDSIAEYAKNAVNYLTANGIFGGYEDNSFRPLNNASRAEAATVVFNMVKLMQLHKGV